MTLKERKIQKILDSRVKGNSEETIALATKLSKNTVKKYLRRYNLLGFLPQPKNPYGTPQLNSGQQGSVSTDYYPSDSKQQLWTPGQIDVPASYYDQSANPLYSILCNENKRLRKENTALNQELLQKIEERNEAKARLQSQTREMEQINQEKEDMKKKVMQLDNQREELSEKAQELTRTMDQKNQEINDMKQAVETLKHELTLKNQQIKEIQKDHREKEQKLNEDLTKVRDSLSLADEKIDAITQEKSQLTQENKRLKETSMKTPWLGYALASLSGAATGIFCYQKFLEITSKLTKQPGVGSRKNTGYSADSKKKANQPIFTIQPFPGLQPLSNTPLPKTNNDFLGGNQQNLP
jgi:ATP-dependent Lon protease